MKRWVEEKVSMEVSLAEVWGWMPSRILVAHLMSAGVYLKGHVAHNGESFYKR